MTIRHNLLFSLAAACVLMAPALASAECATDGDCPVGLQCVEESVPCNPAVPCDCACAEGEEPCECDCPEPEPCEPTTETVCVFPTCESDADCAASYSCQVTAERCSGGGSQGCTCAPCEPGAECPPCECEEPEPAPEPECTVEQMNCLPEEMPCTSNQQCPGGWICEDLPTRSSQPGCVCADAPCSPGDEECPEPECECPDQPADDEEPEQACLPEGLLDSIQQGESQAPVGRDASGDGEGGGLFTDTPNSSAGGDGRSDDEASAGSAGSAGSGSGGRSSAGCSAITGAAAPAGALLMTALFGLLILRRRIG